MEMILKEDHFQWIKSMVESEFAYHDVGECTNSGMLEYIIELIEEISLGYKKGYGDE